MIKRISTFKPGQGLYWKDDVISPIKEEKKTPLISESPLQIYEIEGGFSKIYTVLDDLGEVIGISLSAY